MVDLVAATRANPRVQVGASPRGTLALLKLARCRAVLSGRDYVTPDDEGRPCRRCPPDAPALWVQQIRQDDVVGECLETVPTPAAEDLEPVSE